jgi:hypothetical protein
VGIDVPIVEQEVEAPAVRLRAVHLEMVNAVLAGDGLARVAQITARAVGGPVAIIAPGLGVACVAPTLSDVGGLERYVGERVARRAERAPRLVAAEEPIVAGEDLIGIVALLRSDGPVRLRAAEFCASPRLPR